MGISRTAAAAPAAQGCRQVSQATCAVIAAAVQRGGIGSPINDNL